MSNTKKEALEKIDSLLTQKKELTKNDIVELQKAFQQSGDSAGTADGVAGRRVFREICDRVLAKPELVADINIDLLTDMLSKDLKSYNRDHKTSHADSTQKNGYNAQEHIAEAFQKGEVFYTVRVNHLLDNVDNLTKDQLTDLQTLLKAGGFYKDTIDGIRGNGMEAAEKKFEDFDKELAASLDIDPNSTMYAFQQAKENLVPEGLKPTAENTPPIKADFQLVATPPNNTPTPNFTITPAA